MRTSTKWSWAATVSCAWAGPLRPVAAHLAPMTAPSATGVHEGKVGAVITCLVDRRDTRRQTISFCLDGRALGVAFYLPAWLADVALFPAVCGREDWSVTCRFAGLAFPQAGHRGLAEALAGDVVDGASADGLGASDAAFAPAPQVDGRELRQFDVPDENLLELRSDGDESLDFAAVKQWLAEEHGGGDFHVEVCASGHVAVAAFASHRVARGIAAAPPPHVVVAMRKEFGEAAEELLRTRQPVRGAATDRVARRLIAGALYDDKVLTKEQLRQLRAPRVARPQQVGRGTSDGLGAAGAACRAPAARVPPPAPPMPLETVEGDDAGHAFAPPAPPMPMRDGGPPAVPVPPAAMLAAEETTFPPLPPGCGLPPAAGSGPTARGQAAEATVRELEQAGVASSERAAQQRPRKRAASAVADGAPERRVAQRQSSAGGATAGAGPTGVGPAPGGRLLAGALRGIGAGVTPGPVRKRSGPRNALF